LVLAVNAVSLSGASIRIREDKLLGGQGS
jgi:hypothetical protein